MKFKDRPPIAELLRHPQHISKLAFYTIPLIIVASLFAYRSNLKLLSILLFCLFITSVIHWYKHQNNSIVRYVDIFLAIVLLIVSFYYVKEHKFVMWLITVIIISIIFILNKICYHYQVENISSYFYTLPNSKKRENAHYWSVYIHLFFNHICLLGMGAYCIY
jgi:hypothetical protein